VLLGTLLATLFLTGCALVQETGRRRLSFYNERELQAMAVQAYAEATSKHPRVQSGPEYEMVQRVGRSIATASGRKYDWEFRLLAAPKVVNAFALPGGKIAVYSGLLEVTQNEDALAAVLGHEVAHATSGHSDERLSQVKLKNTVLLAGATYTAARWKKLSDKDRKIAMAALGVGAIAADVAVLRPYSRLHESEADEIGLRFVIRAGYDPYEAPKLWERMARRSRSQTPTFLSTHPHPLDRAKKLRELIPRIAAEEQGKKR
jgi:predicted Zn-dependent protease